MSKSELLVGLDIGTTKICCVVGEQNENGTMNILGVSSSPSTGLRKGVIVNIEQTVESIINALRAAEETVGCEIHSVYTGIAGSHISGISSDGVIAIKGGEVSQRDIDRALDAAKAISIPMDREILHILPQEYVVDGQRGIIDPIGMSGVRLKVDAHIVTGAISSAQNIIRSCKRANLQVSDIVLESLASSKAVLTEEERQLGAIIVDLGGGTSDMAIFINNAIRHTASIPLGGQSLTNDLAFGLRTPTASAEQIKLKYGCVLRDLVDPEEEIEVPSMGGRPSNRCPRQIIADICEPRMEQIFSRIDHEIQRSGYKERQMLAGIVLTGGSALIQGAQELAEQVFNLPVRIGSPINLGEGFTDIARHPMYATAVGLLFYAAENENQGRLSSSNGGGDDGLFKSVLGTMKRWFSEIK